MCQFGRNVMNLERLCGQQIVNDCVFGYTAVSAIYKIKGFFLNWGFQEHSRSKRGIKKPGSSNLYQSPQSHHIPPYTSSILNS